MQCPQCHFSVAPGMAFCGRCGAALAQLCRDCGFANPQGFNFCGACGRDLAPAASPAPPPPTLEDKLAKIKCFLPEGLAEKILSQRDKIEGERKQVTVMFCDLADFTALVETLEPEAAYHIMDQIYELLIHGVHDFEGTVNEFTGDGIMALFGAPISLEDAPQRAIRAAWAIQQAMARFNTRHPQLPEGLPALQMRIGIHTGPVVVGALGNDLQVEFKAVGDTVNVAARTEALAAPGSIFVTEDTFKLTEGFFRFEALGAHKLKGKENKVRIFRVIGPGAHRTRFEVLSERGLTPFVGREPELAKLCTALTRVATGEGQAFFIIGEAGVGKSRFLHEFRKAATFADAFFFEGRCLSYGKATAYHPITDLMKSIFDIGAEAEDDVILGKITKGIKTWELDDDLMGPPLRELLALKGRGVDQMAMSPEARHERKLEAVRQLICKASIVRPLVLIIEDLHWRDPGSEGILRGLVDRIAAARVLLVMTCRPEAEPAWSEGAHRHRMALNRLTPRQSMAVVHHLLGSRAIDRRMGQLIQAKSDGVPFFIEELLRSLGDLGIIEKRGGVYALKTDLQASAIPSTIHDVIMTRVDALPGLAKEVLQSGAAIEREFSHALIARVTGLPGPQLGEELRVLVDAALLYPAGVPPHHTYIFRHALTRDVVYDAILKKKQAKIHARIAAAIEALHGDRLDAHFETLVNHFRLGGDHRKAADYARLACHKADSAGSPHEAAEQARIWIQALEALPPDPTRPQEIIEARTQLGFLLFRMSNMAEAQEAVAPIADLATDRGNPNQLGQIGVILGSCKYMVEEDLPSSIRHLEQAIGVAEQAGDLVTAAYAQYMLGLVLAFDCQFDQAGRFFEILLNLSEALQVPWRIAAMKSNLSVYGYDYRGQVAQGYALSTEAVQIAEASGDIYSKAMAYASHGASCYYRGRFKEARRILRTGIRYTARIDMSAHNAMAHQWLGHVCFDKGDYAQAQAHYHRAIQVREQSRLFPSSTNLYRVALVRAQVHSGVTDVELESLRRHTQNNRVKLYEGALARYIGDILMHLGPGAQSEAGSWIDQAIACDSRNGMFWDLGQDFALQAEYLARRGNFSDARQARHKALTTFAACGSDGWQRRAAKILAHLD